VILLGANNPEEDRVRSRVLGRTSKLHDKNVTCTRDTRSCIFADRASTVDVTVATSRSAPEGQRIRMSNTL
jgi:hypothetical protein